MHINLPKIDTLHIEREGGGIKLDEFEVECELGFFFFFEVKIVQEDQRR